MSARFGLRIARRLRKFRGDRAEFWKNMRELAQRLRNSPGSQAVHRMRRRERMPS